MAFSGKYASIEGILGSSFALGFAEESDSTNQNVNQSLGLISAATVDPVFNVITGNTMLSQTLTSNYQIASNTFFADPLSSEAGYDQEVDVVQYLGFTERVFADTGNSLFGGDFPGPLGGSRVAEGVVVAASNFVFTSPAQDNKVIRAHNISNSLGFQIVATTSAEVDIQNVFALSQAISVQSPFERTHSESGFLKQHLGFTISNKADDCLEKEYSPLIGESESNEFPELQVVKPNLTTGTLLLTYPFTNPTQTLQLNNPEFDNATTLNFTRIDRDTRGGTRKIFSAQKWARWERLEMTVTQLNELTAEDIIDFLNISLGQEIGLEDWEGRKWRGIVVTPDTDIAEQVDGFRLDFTFEGQIANLVVQHGTLEVIHGQDAEGDIQVIHND